MAGEARISSSLSVRKVDGSLVLLDYKSSPATFVADVSSTHGKVPGGFLAGIEGTDADLSQLTTPGLAYFHNADPDNYVEYGTYDPDTGRFHFFGELLPGEGFVMRLSRNFGEDYYGGPGTGTTAATQRLRFKADTAPCWVVAEVFEK